MAAIELERLDYLAQAAFKAEMQALREAEDAEWEERRAAYDTARMDAEFLAIVSR